MFNHFQLTWLTSIEMVIGCHWGIQPIFAHIAHGFLPTALRNKRIDKSLGPGLTCAWGGKQTNSDQFNRIFPYKPSILGYPHLWTPTDQGKRALASNLHGFWLDCGWKFPWNIIKKPNRIYISISTTQQPFFMGGFMDSSPPGSVKKRFVLGHNHHLSLYHPHICNWKTSIVVDKNSWKHYGSLRILHYKI